MSPTFHSFAPSEKASEITCISDDGRLLAGVGHSGGPYFWQESAWHWSLERGYHVFRHLPDFGSLPCTFTQGGKTICGIDLRGPNGPHRLFRFHENEDPQTVELPTRSGPFLFDRSGEKIVFHDSDNKPGIWQANEAFRPFGPIILQNIPGAQQGLPPIDFTGFTCASADCSIVAGTVYTDPVFRTIVWTERSGIDYSYTAFTRDVMPSNISKDGKVIVGHLALHKPNSDGEQSRAVRISEGKVESLGFSVPKLNESRVFSCNENGSLIGGAAVGPDEQGYLVAKAFVWSVNYGPREVERILLNTGIDTSPIRLRYVTHVSADGATIAGSGYNTFSRREEHWVASYDSF